MKITRSEFITVCQQCVKNVKDLLIGVSLLLENETSSKYALGLYMYAIEEYGKLWLLKKVLDTNKEEYTEPRGIFEGTAHKIKIEYGFKHLPDQCKKLSPFLEIKVNTSPKDQIISLEDEDDVLVLAGTTGIFSNIPGSSKRYIQVNFKERCFYIDFDPVDNEERRNLFGETATMKTNVTLFTKAIEESTGIFFNYIN